MKKLTGLILLLAAFVAKGAIPDLNYVDKRVWVSTNGHVNLMHALAEDNLRVPWGGYDVWYQSGSGWNWATLTNYMAFGLTNGQYNAGIRRFYFTDGWQCSARTNGHLAFDASHVPYGPTNSCRIAHENGFQIGVYVQPGSVTSAGFPANNRTNIATDVADYYYAGFDFIRVDWNNAGFSRSNVSYMLDEYRLWRKEMDKYPKPMWLMVSMGGAEENQPGSLSVTNKDLVPQIFEVVNVVQFVNDAGVSSNILQNSLHYWTNILSRFGAMTRLIQYARPGHVTRNDHPLLHLDASTGTGGTYTVNVGWQDVMLDAMMCSVVEPQYAFEDDRANILTNSAVLQILMDPLGEPIHCIHSNTSSQVWAGRLSAGRLKVAFLNTTTNVNDTNTFEFVNMGWPTNTVAEVWDVLTNKIWAAPVTNGFSVVLPALCNSNYILRPLLNF